MKQTKMLSEISEMLSLEYSGGDEEIEMLNFCNAPTTFSQIISFVTNRSFLDCVKDNNAIKALFIKPEDIAFYQEIQRDISFLPTESPEYDFYRLHHLLLENTDFYGSFEFEPIIGDNCNIHPTAIIENGVEIGSNVTIGAHSVIRKRTVIRDNVKIGCNSVIGSEGFQIIKYNGKNISVKHSGGTLIENNCDIGDCSTISNNLFEGNTKIDENSKIARLVSIAHNCKIGKNVVITAGVVFCGSCVVEDNVWIGPNSTILNKRIIGKNALIGTGTKVITNVPPNSTYLNKTDNTLLRS